MHHWVTYCVNRCTKSEVIAVTSFVTDGARTPSISMTPPPPNGFAMAGDKYHPHGWEKQQTSLTVIGGKSECSTQK